MILTDYYTFRHLPESKSKMRFDCVASTQSYPEFEGLRNKFGSLFVYYGVNKAILITAPSEYELIGMGIYSNNEE